MADHLDSPGPIAINVGDDTANVGSPNGDPRTDITDVFAFLKPGDPSKSILILDVNPLAPLLAGAFNSQAVYEINVDTNVFGIVLEVPNSALGTTAQTTSLWGRTLLDQNGGLVRDDRMARAAINTVFNHGQDKNVFNNIDPSDDLTAATTEGITFVTSFANTLKALGGDPGLATVLLPDVLNYNFSKPTSYAALNGRRLQDDVIDISLGLITGGGLKTDNVGPHSDYLPEFPYLGTPH